MVGMSACTNMMAQIWVPSIHIKSKYGPVHLQPQLKVGAKIERPLELTGQSVQPQSSKLQGQLNRLAQQGQERQSRTPGILFRPLYTCAHACEPANTHTHTPMHTHTSNGF